MTNDPAITVSKLSKSFTIGETKQKKFHAGIAERIRGGLGRAPDPRGGEDRVSNTVWALRDVSFDVMHGERIGIIGPNGAGKTTLLRILSRIIYPTEGEVRIRARLTSLLDVGTGFNDNLTGRENVYFNSALHGMSRQETDAIYGDIVEFSGLARFMDTPLRHYSSGMRARLGFSVAANLDPDVLLLDEVLAVGDIGFQQQCLRRIDTMTSAGRTLLFVSHSLGAISRFCDRVIWLDEGRIAKDGPAREVLDDYSEAMLNLVSGRTGADGGGDVLEGGNARLLGARVHRRSGAEIKSVRVDEEIGLTVEFESTTADDPILPAFRLYDDKDTFLFPVIYPRPDGIFYEKRKGAYRATAWIPPHLLNVGPVFVSVGLNTPGARLERHVVLERVLSFVVVEAVDGVITAAGPYPALKGAVRPLLEWDVEEFRQEGRLFFTTVPKSGKNLIYTFLAELGIKRIDNKKHAQTKNLACKHSEITFIGDPTRLTGYPLPLLPPNEADETAQAFETLIQWLNRLKRGRCLSHHICHTQEIASRIRKTGAPSAFLYRDPRDVLVSMVNYVHEMGMPPHYAERAQGRSKEETCLELLEGSDYMVPFRTYLNAFIGWLDEDWVFPIRFEDVVGARGGGSGERQHEVLGALARHMQWYGDEAILERAINRAFNPKSTTFFRGQIGTWKNFFTPAIKAAFAEHAGNILSRWGYE